MKIESIKKYFLNDEINIDMIIDEFSPYVKKVINNMVNINLNQEDKEEIMSDVFFILWKSKLNNIENLKAYIVGITKNLVREKLKKKKVTYDITEFENVIDYSSNVDIYIEDRLDIQKGISILNEKELEIFNLFYYSNDTAKEIAFKLNMTEVNVSTKLHRIRNKIRKELKIGGIYGRE